MKNLFDDIVNQPAEQGGLFDDIVSTPTPAPAPAKKDDLSLAVPTGRRGEAFAFRRMGAAAAKKSQEEAAAQAVADEEARRDIAERQSKARKGPVEPKKQPTQGVGSPMPFALSERAGQQLGEDLYKYSQGEGKIPYKQLYEDDANFKVVKDYMAYIGEPMKEGQSKEELVKGFMSHMRFAENNITFGGSRMANRQSNAEGDANKMKIAKARELYENTADFIQKGGQPGLRPVAEIAVAQATDPVNYVAPAAGKLVVKGTREAVKKINYDLIKSVAELEAKKSAAKTVAAKKAIDTQIDSLKSAATQQTDTLVAKATPKARATSAVVEGTLSAGTNVADQRTDIQTQKILTGEDVEIDNAQVLVSSLIGGTIGYATGNVFNTRIKDAGTKLDKVLKEKQPIAAATPNQPATPGEKVVYDAMVKNMDDVVSEMMKREGDSIMRQLDPLNVITEPKLRSDFAAAASRIALKVAMEDPNFVAKKGQQASDMIARVFASVDKIDDAVLERAMKDSGLSEEDFARVYKATLSEAGRTLGTAGPAGKFLKKLGQVDPAFDKRLNALYSRPNSYVTYLDKAEDLLYNGVQLGKAFIVSGIDTTMRNIAGLGSVLTLDTAINGIESFMFAVGKTANDVIDGKAGVDTIKKNFGDALKDATSDFYYIVNSGLSEEITDTLLKSNPNLLRKLTEDLQDIGQIDDTNAFQKVGRMVNVVNTASDAFFRRAMFAASVDRQLRAVGMDLYKDILIPKKPLPPEVLSKAIDDTLVNTFSYKYKRGAKDTVGGPEGAVESAAGVLLDVVEHTKYVRTATGMAVPFARFIANAIAFQYKYSPLGGFTGAYQGWGKVDQLLKEGKTEAAMVEGRATQKRVLQGVIGTGLMAAAYQYRMENPDAAFDELKINEEERVSARPIFPWGNFLAVGEIAARIEQGVDVPKRELLETLIGLKMGGGSTEMLIEKAGDLASGDPMTMQSFSETMGKFLGDQAGRYTAPFVIKNVYDLFNMFTPDGTLVRDPNVIEGDTATERFVDAFTNKVQSRLPAAIASEENRNPAAEIRGVPQEVVREGEFTNRLFGTRIQPKNNEFLKEVNTLGLDLYKLYPKPTGVKEYDRLITAKTDEQLNIVTDAYMKSDYYKNLIAQGNGGLNARREMLRNGMEIARKQGKDIAEATLQNQDPMKIFKSEYLAVSDDVRKSVENMFKKANNGQSMFETGSFDQFRAYREMHDMLTGKPAQQRRGLMAR